MKYYLLLLCAGLSLLASAQSITFRSGAVQPADNVRAEAVDSFNRAAQRFQGQTFAVLQFKALPTVAQQKGLVAAGIALLEYLPQNAYTVSLAQPLTVAGLQAAGAKAFFQLSPQQKMAHPLPQGVMPAWAVKVPGTVDVWISFPKTLSPAVIINALKQANVELLSDRYGQYRVLELRIAAARLTELASLPFVEYVQPAPPAPQPLNFNSRTGSRASALNASVADGGYGLNGEGVTIGVGDNADVESHADFAGRLINRSPAGYTGHGTHVTGTAAGAGNIYEPGRGYAPKATVVTQVFGGILDNAPVYVQDYGMVITNNSYGNIIDCEYHGTYDLCSRIMDQQALDLPHLLHLFSAGNSGGSTCAPYPFTYRTVIGGYQSAKNVITVGGSIDSTLRTFPSSKGPVKDGRLKPEILVQGRSVLSTLPNNGYGSSTGTSMASPGAAGGLALLYQRYRQKNGGANPLNGLMKAILCNGAMDLGNAGPDFDNGFGWMNLVRSVEAVDNSQYFTGNSVNAATTIHTVTVPANTAQLKVLLYWNDVPASVLSNKTLVNDLDLEVVSPSASTSLPYVLDTAMGALAAPAFTAADHVNNVEQVVVNNPVAGVYTFRITGHTVTTAQQPYFVAYDAVPVQLKVTSPAGGTPLIPGERIKIAWDVYGLTGTANFEFSPDGGATWSTVEAGVNLARSVYTWTVPSVATTNALVRITKTGTGETSTSNAFTILGEPTISLAPVQCEGYIAVNWTVVASATDYEVMMLRGGEMQSVAVTTGTSYTLSGLSSDRAYFVTVRARLAGKPGRRAYAISRQPNGGACAGTISDNDLKLDAITAPVSGRLYTSTQLTASQQVTVRIKNLDDAPASSFTVAYTLNGTLMATETVTATVAAGATHTHTFSATANLSAVGHYTLRAYVAAAGDAVSANDTATVVVKQIDNQPLDLIADFVDNLEAAVPADYRNDTMGLGGIERYDFGRSTVYGRARTFVNTGFARSGSKAITLDASQYVPSGSVSYLYGTFNLSNYTTADDIRLGFQYLHHHQEVNASNRVWVRGSDTQPWIEAYNLDELDGDAGSYQKSNSVEISNVLAAAGQSLTSSLGVRWGQYGQIQATDLLNGAGYTIDDIKVYQVFNDAQLRTVQSPAENNCGLTASTAVTVSVRNPGTVALTNVPVKYSVNGGAFVSEVIPSVAASSTLTYTFAAPADLSAVGTYTLVAIVEYPADSFRENDTATATVHNAPVVTTFPYLQDFESGNGGFFTAGTKRSWEYGTPVNAKISGAASGAKAWKTALAGRYNDLETSYLYTPCFDVTGMTSPTLSFSVALDLEDCGTNLCDGAWVEYSADGITWAKLGAAGTGTNWYNKAGTQQLWSVQNYTRWHVATQALPTGLSRLQLRFVMATDPFVGREGVAIDDVHVYDNTGGIYDGPTMASPTTQPASGSGWVHFTEGGKLVASVHPSGQNLGNTDAQAYIHTGSVRTASNQYYHNRNVTIKPATQPGDSIAVRFYFLDSETEALLSASGCAPCSKPRHAYQLGVSKYTNSNKAVENGTVSDNAGGVWQFIVPAAVRKVPFDKGYYAEFKAAGFSEFWLNNGGLSGLATQPLKLISFNAARTGSDVKIDWTVSGEESAIRYEVEVARGNADLAASRFVKVGEITGNGTNTGEVNYKLTDTESSKTGIRYYRLKITAPNGSVQYSAVKAVVFGDAVVVWQVYPNPSYGLFNLVYQCSTGETVRATLYDAKGRLVKEHRSTASGFLQKLGVDVSANNYASGIYLLRVMAEGRERTFPLYKH